MKRFWKLIVAVFVFTALTATTAFASGWTTGQEANAGRWWYDLGNGQYYGNSSQQVEWQWLDGNGDGIAECYAFDQTGWMYADEITPDGYQVNEDGAWTVNGAVQTMPVAAGYAGTRAQSQQPQNDGHKTLIAYFSWSGTTAEAAREIQQATGGDLFEITVADAYPSSYQSTAERARRERDQNERPALGTAAPDLSGYDVLLVGYPIWWHTAPMVIDTFLESYDLTGKTVLPFSTSGGSDIEESMADVRRVATGHGAAVGTGLNANSLSQSRIQEWLNSNGIY